MNRRQLGELALLTYPAESRNKNGQEILGTLLDAGDESAASFWLQVLSVCWAGLADRSRQAYAVPRTFVARILRAAAVAGMVAQWFVAVAYPSFPNWWTLAFVASPVAIIAGRERLGGLIGLAGFAALIIFQSPWFWHVSPLIRNVIPIAGCCSLVLRPSRHAVETGALVVFAGTIGVVSMLANGLGPTFENHLPFDAAIIVLGTVVLWPAASVGVSLVYVTTVTATALAVPGYGVPTTQAIRLLCVALVLVFAATRSVTRRRSVSAP